MFPERYVEEFEAKAYWFFMLQFLPFFEFLPLEEQYNAA